MIPRHVLNRLKEQAKAKVVQPAPKVLKKVETATTTATEDIVQPLSSFILEEVRPSDYVAPPAEETETTVTKKELIKTLTELGVTFNKFANKAELLELLKEHGK